MMGSGDNETDLKTGLSIQVKKASGAADCALACPVDESVDVYAVYVNTVDV
jgi:hypothetical protein